MWTPQAKKTIESHVALGNLIYGKITLASLGTANCSMLGLTGNQLTKDAWLLGLSLIFNVRKLRKNSTCQGIIQKKSASGSWMLPCLLIFFENFILIWKCQKWSLNSGTLLLVNKVPFYSSKCPFFVLPDALLWF